MKIYHRLFASIISVVLFNTSQSHDLDECILLENELRDSLAVYDLDEDPRISRYDRDWIAASQSGIIFKIKNDVFLRTKENNIIIDEIAPEIFLFTDEGFYGDKEKPEYKSYDGFIINKINTIEVRRLDDSEIIEILKNALTNRQLLNLDMSRDDNFESIILDTNFYQSPVYIDLALKQLINIDSSRSTFSASFDYTYYWEQQGVTEIGSKIFEKKFKSSDFEGYNISPGFYCTFDLATIQDELRIYVPFVELVNLVSSDNTQRTITYHFSAEDEDIEANGFWQMAVSQTATLKNDFHYKSFPFDSQRITFEFREQNRSHVIPLMIFSDEAISSWFNDVSIPEWTLTSYEINHKIENDFIYESTESHVLGLSLDLIIEREFNYYLIKVYLPILFILIVSLSILFIPPTQLEERLTVSTVCFLALIAYTFVIDDDIPKLSYMTIMDNIILISYFFATLPIIQSIYLNRLIQSDAEYVFKVNVISQKIIPFIYVLAILLITAYITYNSDNVISALKF